MTVLLNPKLNKKVKINSLNDIQSFISNNLKGDIIWIGTRGLDGMGFDKLFNFKKYFCADSGMDLNVIENVISLEQKQQVRNKKAQSFSGAVELFINTTNSISQEFKSNLCILPYESSLALEDFCNKNNFLLLSNTAELKNKLQDKLNLPSLLKESGIDEIPSIIANISDLSYKAVKAQLCSKFVIQSALSSSGNGTFIVSNATEFTDLLLELQQNNVVTVKVSKFIIGPSLNINACVVSQGVLCGTPSFQIIGAKECRKNSTGYCGNAWFSNMNSSTISEIMSITKKVGSTMQASGYKGLFGIDFIQDEKTGKVYVVEINARYQGSTQLLSMLQMQNSQIPLVAFNIADYLNSSYTVDINAYNNISKVSFNAFQIILYFDEKFISEVTNSVKPGIYDFDGVNLIYKRPGLVITDILKDSKTEVLITCGVPEKGKTIYPESRLCKIQGYLDVFDIKKKSLNATGSALANKAFSLFDLKEARM